MNRRGLLRLGLGAAAAIAAPAIVARENIMRIRVPRQPELTIAPFDLTAIDPARQQLAEHMERLLKTELGIIERFTIHTSEAIDLHTGKLLRRYVMRSQELMREAQVTIIPAEFTWR